MKRQFYVSVTSTYKVTEETEGDAIKECMRKRNPPEPIARQANVCLDTSPGATPGVPQAPESKSTVLNIVNKDKDILAMNVVLREGKLIMARWFLGELEAAGSHGTATTFKMTLAMNGFDVKELEPKLINAKAKPEKTAANTSDAEVAELLHDLEHLSFADYLAKYNVTPCECCPSLAGQDDDVKCKNAACRFSKSRNEALGLLKGG